MMKKIILFFILLIFTGCQKEDIGVDDSIVDNSNDVGSKNEEETSVMKVKVNGYDLEVSLINNSSTNALVELLKQGDIEVVANDYGDFEKVGSLPQSLPRNDENISTIPGDVILYQGNSICFYYGYNTWTFTKLGHINMSQDELKRIYGNGSATFTLSL